MKGQPHGRLDAGDPAVLDHQIGHRLLEQMQVRLVLDHRTHRGLVERAIGLGTGGAHGRALARVEGAKLNAATIGRAAHDAAQRIDLAHQMPLADAADRRVARHLADGFDIVGEQQRTRAHAGGRGRGLGPGVAAADNDDVELRLTAHVRTC